MIGHSDRRVRGRLPGRRLLAARRPGAGRRARPPDAAAPRRRDARRAAPRGRGGAAAGRASCRSPPSTARRSAWSPGPPRRSRRCASGWRRGGIDGRPLHTSHAFHSAMMEPMLAPFAERVRKVKLSPPRLPYLSNVTGTWIRPEEATDPLYWARAHPRHRALRRRRRRAAARARPRLPGGRPRQRADHAGAAAPGAHAGAGGAAVAAPPAGGGGRRPLPARHPGPALARRRRGRLERLLRPRAAAARAAADLPLRAPALLGRAAQDRRAREGSRTPPAGPRGVVLRAGLEADRAGLPRRGGDRGRLAGLPRRPGSGGGGRRPPGGPGAGGDRRARRRPLRPYAGERAFTVDARNAAGYDLLLEELAAREVRPGTVLHFWNVTAEDAGALAARAPTAPWSAGSSA